MISYHSDGIFPVLFSFIFPLRLCALAGFNILSLYFPHVAKQSFLSSFWKYFSHNNGKNTNLTTDYCFFDIPQPVSPSKIQVFQQFLNKIPKSNKNKVNIT